MMRNAFFFVDWHTNNSSIIINDISYRTNCIDRYFEVDMDGLFVCLLACVNIAFIFSRHFQQAEKAQTRYGFSESGTRLTFLWRIASFIEGGTYE